MTIENGDGEGHGGPWLKPNSEDGQHRSGRDYLILLEIIAAGCWRERCMFDWVWTGKAFLKAKRVLKRTRPASSRDCVTRPRTTSEVVLGLDSQVTQPLHKHAIQSPRG